MSRASTCWSSWIMCAAALWLISGCSSTEVRYYALVAPSISEGIGSIASDRQPLVVGDVRIPDSTDRKQLVTQLSRTRVNVRENSQWASPLKEQVAKIIARDLQVRLGASFIVSVDRGLLGEGTPELTLEIERFDAQAGRGVEVSAHWRIERASKVPSPLRSATIRRPWIDSDDSSLVLAWSEALDGLSNLIAKTISADL